MEEEIEGINEVRGRLVIIKQLIIALKYYLQTSK
jgi:hypothetical protein